jgi:hypothetical protein
MTRKNDFVKDKFGKFIPRGLARYAADNDSYLRDCVVRCQSCGASYTLGESDSADVCMKCCDEAGEENARLDGNA